MNTNWFCSNISNSHGQSAIGQKGAYWKPGEIIYVKFLGGSESQRQYITEVMRFYEKICNIKFQTIDVGISDIRIGFSSQDGAWSYVGVENRSIPQDQKTMNLGWLESTKHEFGHALGLLHEHQSYKSRIQFNKPVVIKDLSGPPNNWSLNTIQYQVFDREPAEKVDSTDEWDMYSVMEYPIPQSWDLLGVGAPGSEDLSLNDVIFLQKIYPFEIVQPTTDLTKVFKEIFSTITELSYLRKTSLVKLGLKLLLNVSDKKTFKVNLELVRQKLGL